MSNEKPIAPISFHQAYRIEILIRTGSIEEVSQDDMNAIGRQIIELLTKDIKPKPHGNIQEIAYDLKSITHTCTPAYVG